MVFKNNDVILFQGDSITDVGRSRERIQGHDHEALGRGYAAYAASTLLLRHADLNLTLYNRGISGNKVTNLAERWQTDCLNLKPTVVSILIGVNDTWHGMKSEREGVPLDRYEKVYRQLLKDTQNRLPGVKLVLCEPFVLRCGAVTEAWFPEIDERRAIVKRLADEFNTVFVPFQSAFDQALKHQPRMEYWLHDGVHPTMAGHALMAESWLETLMDHG